MKEMRYKFIFVTFNSLLLIVILILGTIYISASYSNHKQVQKRMEKVLKNDGASLKDAGHQLPDKEPTSTKEDFLSSTFAVKLDDERNVLQVIGNAKEEYSDETIRKYIKESIHRGKEKGNIGNMNYLMDKKDYGSMIVYSDYSEQDFFLDNLFRICLIVGVFGCLLIGILIWKLSYWIVNPAEKALEMQKVFISNASHELRTPLTIITANAQLLKHQLKDNKWLKMIESNADKMNTLVNELLNMSQMENAAEKTEFKVFNLSKTVQNVALSMDSIAYEMQKSLDAKITEDIRYYGDLEKLKELTSILLDNALKYSNEGGEIRITLQERNKRPLLEVFNSGNPIPKKDSGKIFDRFYRGTSDQEKSSPGFGLGLAIALAIVKLHHGKISFENLEGKGVKFIVRL